MLPLVCRHEKRRDPAILDRGQILGEMWTFLPQTTRHFCKSGFCGFGKTISTTQNLSG